MHCTGHLRPRIAYRASHLVHQVNFLLAQASPKYWFKGSNLRFMLDDGCLRLYLPDSPRVAKAIQGIGSEVEAIVFLPRSGKANGDVWLAIQHKVCSGIRVLISGM